MPLKLQVMEGVGTPVEVQEMSTESPSRTVTVGPLMAVVLELSACTVQGGQAYNSCTQSCNINSNRRMSVYIYVSCHEPVNDSCFSENHSPACITANSTSLGIVN